MSLVEGVSDIGGNAKAVIVANLYGTMFKLDEICQICDAHGALLIEYEAESLGATYKGRLMGAIWKYNVFGLFGG